MKLTIDNRDDFKYIDCTELPKIILGIKCHDWYFDKDTKKEEFDFIEGREWKKIAHQTAGVGCHQHYILGIILKPKSVDILKAMNSLSKKWDSSNTGCFGVSLNELNEYRDDLKRHFDLDCNNSYSDFEEGIYPIDCSKEALEKMTDEQLPESLDDLIVWEKEINKFFGCIGRWNLWILGKNSD